MNNETSAAAMPRQMPPDAVLMQMLFGGLMQQCISVAAKLGIADLLAEKSQTAAELAAQTDTDETSLYRLLRLLASVGVFAKTADNQFSLTPIAALLQSNVPNSMRNFAIMQSEDWTWRGVGQLLHSVQTGKTGHSKVHGVELFEFLANSAEDEKKFYLSMTDLSISIVPPIVEAYDFSGAKKVADIAGGQGFLLAGILKANPQAQGILFDLPTVIKVARERLEKEDVADRVEFVLGDFFAEVPGGADVYIVKYIIHDWTDGQSVKILKNIHSAMNDDGKLLIIEAIVPEDNSPSVAKIMDIQMLVTTGGSERTENEYRKLLDASGFRLTRVIPTKSSMSIIEAVKS